MNRDKKVRVLLADDQALVRSGFSMILGAQPDMEVVGEADNGEDAVRGYYAVSRAAFPDQRNEVVALHHADDVVAVEFDLLGTHLGPLRALPPTGRSFRCRMTAFFIFDGSGLICERVYFDTATILRQLTG